LTHVTCEALAKHEWDLHLVSSAKFGQSTLDLGPLKSKEPFVVAAGLQHGCAAYLCAVCSELADEQDMPLLASSGPTVSHVCEPI